MEFLGLALLLGFGAWALWPKSLVLSVSEATAAGFPVGDYSEAVGDLTPGAQLWLLARGPAGIYPIPVVVSSVDAVSQTATVVAHTAPGDTPAPGSVIAISDSSAYVQGTDGASLLQAHGLDPSFAS